MKLISERGLMQWPVSILQCSQCSSHALKNHTADENTQMVALFICNASVELCLWRKKSKLNEIRQIVSKSLFLNM